MLQTKVYLEPPSGPLSTPQELVEIVAGGLAALKLCAALRLCISPRCQDCPCHPQAVLPAPWGPQWYFVAHQCPLLAGSASQVFTPAGRATSRPRAFFCIPVQVEGRLAAWQVGSHPEHWGEALPTALAALLSLAAVALKDLLLATTPQQRAEELEAQLEEACRSLLHVQEAERQRVCLEIHDGMADTLAGVQQMLQPLLHALPPSSPSRELARRVLRGMGRAIQELRGIMSGLQPVALQSRSLAEALREEADRLRRLTGARVEVQVEEADLPHELAFGLLRIVQEALANVREHAQARRVRIVLRPDQESLLLEVRDWGQGFDPAAPPQHRIGMFSMRQRAQLLGGECHLVSSPGAGTTVIVRVPLPSLQAPLLTLEQ